MSDITHYEHQEHGLHKPVFPWYYQGMPLQQFASWYMVLETGPNRMHSQQTISDAMSGILDDTVRNRWWASSNQREIDLATAASDVVQLFNYHNDAPVATEP